MTADVDDRPWISVRADTAATKTMFTRGSPLILLGAIRVGLMMDRGKGTSEGAGTAGLVVGLIAVALPVLWGLAFLSLRAANARIRLEDGLLSIRTAWGRTALAVPVETVTGVHVLRLPVDREKGARVVITADGARPVMIAVRAWQPDGLRELWQHLGAPVRDHGALTWPQLRARFPGLRVPFRLAHQGVTAALLVVAVIAYIALVVNLPFLL